MDRKTDERMTELERRVAHLVNEVARLKNQKGAQKAAHAPRVPAPKPVKPQKHSED